MEIVMYWKIGNREAYEPVGKERAIRMLMEANGVDVAEAERMVNSLLTGEVKRIRIGKTARVLTVKDW